MSVRLTGEIGAMAYLDKIIKQSPWILDADKIAGDVHLSRLQKFPLVHFEQHFLTHDFQDGVYIVTGPRQIGKSTHLKLLLQQRLNAENKENYLYFNCDLLDTKQDLVELVEEYLAEFPSDKRRFILLDEITSVKDSFLAIKYLVDSGHLEGLTYILTGSNTISIKKTGEYLPGRRGKGIDFHFHPLSYKAYLQLRYPEIELALNLDSSEKDFIEINQQVNLARECDVYLKTGGFPRVINEYHMNQEISDDIFMIYRSWLTSEIAKADKKEHIAKMILGRCLFSLSSDVSYNAFAQDTGIGSHNTVYDYLDFFDNASVLSPIYHYDLNQKKVNFRKNKKIYFNDPFIYAVVDAWLTGKPRQDFLYLQQPSPKSKLIENLVYIKMASVYNEVYFNKSQNEIDFVANNTLVEVKYQNRIVPNDYQYLAQQANAYKKVIVTKNYFKQDSEILLRPIEFFLLCE